MVLSSSTGLGKLDYGQLVKFEAPLQAMRRRVNAHLDNCRNSSIEANRAIGVYSLAAESAFRQLTSFDSSLRQNCLCLVEMQNSYLFAIAALDWMEVYRPRYEGTLPPASSVAKTMGAFVHDLKIAARFALAGIPVWVIIPFDEVKATRVDALVPILDPKDFLEVSPARASSVFYRGVPGKPAFHQMTIYYSRSLAGVNPFITFNAGQNISGMGLRKGKSQQKPCKCPQFLFIFLYLPSRSSISSTKNEYKQPRPICRTHWPFLATSTSRLVRCDFTNRSSHFL
jgi:hypothetical protein